MQKSNSSRNVGLSSTALSQLFLTLVSLALFMTEVSTVPIASQDSKPKNSDGNELPNNIDTFNPATKCGSGFTSTSTTRTPPVVPSAPGQTEEMSDDTRIVSEITLFTASEKSGIGHHLTFQNVDVCEVLPPYMQNRVNSVDTHGTCVFLCEDFKCSSCVKFQPGSKSHDRLKRINFHNKAKSAIAC